MGLSKKLSLRQGPVTIHPLSCRTFSFGAPVTLPSLQGLAGNGFSMATPPQGPGPLSNCLHHRGAEKPSGIMGMKRLAVLHSLGHSLPKYLPST